MLKIIKKYYYVIIILIVSVFGFIFIPNNEKEVVTFNPIPTSQQQEEIKYMYVDIKGEIMNPGVYKIKESTRLFQLIILAGGVTNEADELGYNLSTKLKDEQIIYIPSINDELSIITEIEENSNNESVNINLASLEQLDTLPGIGPSTARSIIEYREENGYFETIDDLINVPGIGEATLNEIREFITT